MKLSDYQKTYYTYTEKASETCRSAAYAGVAIAWVFKLNDALKLPPELIAPVCLFAAGLGFDLLQYVVGSVIWGAFHWHHESKLVNIQDDPELCHSRVYLHIINSLFVTKVILVMVGYGLLVAYIVKLWLV